MSLVHGCDREDREEEERIRNKKKIHTEIVKKVLKEQQIHPLIQQQAPDVNKTEEQLPRATRRTLAQLRAGKCPLLKAYLHSIEAEENPNCPLCGQREHTTRHLFECSMVPTTLTPEDLWHRPTMVAELVGEWQAALGAAEEA